MSPKNEETRPREVQISPIENRAPSMSSSSFSSSSDLLQLDDQYQRRPHCVYDNVVSQCHHRAAAAADDDDDQCDCRDDSSSWVLCAARPPWMIPTQ